MKKSLNDVITEAVVTNSSKDVTIHERTLVTELIESENEDDPFSLYDFLPNVNRGKNLILTRYLIYVCHVIVLFPIAICYALYDLTHKIFTGKWKSKPLNKKVRKRRIPNKKWIKKLHPEKWRGIQSSMGINLVILIATLIMAVIAFVLVVHFILKEVVLPDNSCKVNHHGVVTFDQGCMEEQHFFLLNAATFWTNTGIAVSEGDKVFITASGSMYSDVDDMVEAAENNKKPLYSRSDFYKQYEKKDEDAEYCIYGRFFKDTMDVQNKPVFGSLLYQICDEVNEPIPYNNSQNPTAVKQINFAKNKNSIFNDKRYHFKADKSGILYFSFNDILLDDSMLINIFEDVREHHKKKESWKIYEDLRKMIDLATFKSGKFDTLQWLKDSVDSLIWFEDNFGEALINIRVEKNVWNTHLPLHKKLLVTFYRKMDALYTKTEKGFPSDFLHSNLLILILLVLAWFGVDAVVSKQLKKT